MYVTLWWRKRTWNWAMKRCNCRSPLKTTPTSKRSKIRPDSCSQDAEDVCILSTNKDKNVWNATEKQCDTHLEVEEVCAFNINNMPASILLQVFNNLNLCDLLKRAALVCKRWNRLSVDADLWREINFNGLLKITDDVLLKYTNINSRLSFLDVTDLRLITNHAMETAVSHCVHLKTLTLVR